MCMKLDSEAQAVNNEQFNQLLADSTEWPNNIPVEDLTGEVQELMMRYILQNVTLLFAELCINCLGSKGINELLVAALDW